MIQQEDHTTIVKRIIFLTKEGIENDDFTNIIFVPPSLLVDKKRVMKMFETNVLS
jgi:hypothetical protein